MSGCVSCEVTPCGKEAMRMCANDYTVQYENRKYPLDMHLKHGNHAANLLRIYFC